MNLRTSVLDPADLRIWERQHDEPARVWFAFRWHRDHPQASLTQVAEEANVAPQTVSKWAQDWGWAHRVREYQRWLDRESTAAAKATLTVEAMNASHLTDARALREVALQQLRRLMVAAEVPGQERLISGPTVVRALELAAKLERLALGKPTDIVGDEDDAPDYSTLTDEQFKALVELERAARKKST